jgi:hypothetical protein
MQGQLYASFYFQRADPFDTVLTSRRYENQVFVWQENEEIRAARRTLSDGA